ncbi:MAG TPA: glycosyltransferase family 4 protein [Dermatophilaceae bacterium]|nr:glycosyltransferase family 4 protein [Dermatophilaceae bacterium]
MRIALVLGTSSGGVGRHVHGLARELRSRGHGIVVACPPPVESQFRFAETGAKWAPVAMTDRPRPDRDATALARLRSVVRGADVVHAHGLRAGSLACLAATGSGTPVVVTLHNAPPAGRMTSRMYAVLERIVARRATAVLGVSSDLLARQRDLGARTSGLAVIPAPRGPGEVTDRHTVRSSLGLAEGTSMAVCVGRLAPQKGLDLLLDAVARLRDLPLVVVVAGEGPERAHLAERIAAEDLPVRLLGHRSDILDLLSAADVVVSSSVWEGQPISLQEALQVGAAIVATDVGGTAAVLGDAGLLTAPGDDNALAAAIRLVVTYGSERDRLRSHAFERAAALPDEAAAADAALAVYERVLVRS